MVSVWAQHPELDEKLISLRGEGLSNSAIARALGYGITRNAVIGRANRIGAPSHGSDVPQHNRKPRAFVLPPVTDPHRRKAGDKPGPTVLRPLDRQPEPARDENGNLITVMNATDKHCRYTYGDIRAGDFHYCGHTINKKGGRFCDFHDGPCHQEQHPPANRSRAV